jgi:hypothetical protein
VTVTRRDVFEQLLLCWKKAEQQLAGELLEDEHARDEELLETQADWWEQWEQAGSEHPRSPPARPA